MKLPVSRGEFYFAFSRRTRLTRLTKLTRITRLTKFY